MSKKYVLITGGAGLIGSHLCDSLIKQNYHLTCIDNFISGKYENIKHLINSNNFNFIEADVSRPSAYKKISNLKFDFIFHLASPASPSGYQNHPIQTYKVNSFGTHYLLNLAKKHCCRFLFASTSEIYGDPLIHPQNENYWGNVNPIGPRSIYDESKRYGEMACMTFFRQFKLDIRIIRIFNTYGPRNDLNDGRVVPNFIKQALENNPLTVFGNGQQTRSFCYVLDLVKGIEKAMFTNNLSGLVVNLGNPDEFKIIDFANIVIKLSNSKSKIIYKLLPEDDPKQRKPDISRAKNILNWQPEIDIYQGLIPTIKYFQNIIDNNGKKN